VGNSTSSGQCRTRALTQGFTQDCVDDVRCGPRRSAQKRARQHQAFRLAERLCGDRPVAAYWRAERRRDWIRPRGAVTACHHDRSSATKIDTAAGPPQRIDLHLQIVALVDGARRRRAARSASRLEFLLGARVAL